MVGGGGEVVKKDGPNEGQVKIRDFSLMYFISIRLKGAYP